MNTTSNELFKRPSKAQLTWFLSLVITVILSVPRLLLMVSEIQPEGRFIHEPFEWSPRFIVRLVFNFLFCLLFFTLNFQTGSIKLPGIGRVDFDRFSHRLGFNFLFFLAANFLIIYANLILIKPIGFQEIFIKAYTLLNLLIFFVTLIISQGYIQFFKNQELLLANESLKKKNAESQFEVLKNQVNPHFLFNSFNTLRGIIQAKPIVAVDFVNNMSDVFRYSLKSTKENVVKLSEEIYFISAYLEILKERFGTKFKAAVDIDVSCYSYFLPPMSIQILVENALKHNIVSEQKPLQLFIRSVTEYQISISNNLQERKEQEPSMGMGLYNLNERYKYIAGLEIRVEKKEHEFVVIIPLLKHEGSNR